MKGTNGTEERGKKSKSGPFDKRSVQTRHQLNSHLDVLCLELLNPGLRGFSTHGMKVSIFRPMGHLPTDPKSLKSACDKICSKTRHLSFNNALRDSGKNRVDHLGDAFELVVFLMFDVCPYSRGDVLSQRVMVGNDKWLTVTGLIFSKWMLRFSIFVDYIHDLCTTMHFWGYLLIHQRLELFLQTDPLKCNAPSDLFSTSFVELSRIVSWRSHGDLI